MTVLSDLAIAGRGRVLGIQGADEISLRLLEMGITPEPGSSWWEWLRWEIPWSWKCVVIV